MHERGGRNVGMWEQEGGFGIQGPDRKRSVGYERGGLGADKLFLHIYLAAVAQLCLQQLHCPAQL